MVETGQFATLWKNMAEKIGLDPEFIKTDWRIGADPAAIEEHLRQDKSKEIKAVCVLHNETSTGCLSPVAEIRKAIDAAGHPALFFVDTISSLASTDYRHDEWGVDVTVGGAQKGLMLPPGMSFNAISDKALAASKNSKLMKSFWAWDDMLNMNKIGFFPYTPATQMLHGLAAGIDMLHEEGLDNVFARHDRLAEATRRAVRAWGLEIMCRDPKYHSPTVTAVMLPEGHDADAFRNFALDTFNISYGASFGRYAGKYFRIGHLGDINDGYLMGALATTEMALALAGIPHKKGGVQAALRLSRVGARAGPGRRRASVAGIALLHLVCGAMPPSILKVTQALSARARRRDVRRLSPRGCKRQRRGPSSLRDPRRRGPPQDNGPTREDSDETAVPCGCDRSLRARLGAGAALAQGYPSKPVRIIVPFVAGGAVDTLARMMGAKLSESLGQPVIVENRPGAGGNVAADAVAKSPPDGYTILQNTNGQAISPAIYRSLPFDVVRDFIPVTQIVASQLVLARKPEARGRPRSRS